MPRSRVVIIIIIIMIIISETGTYKTQLVDYETLKLPTTYRVTS